MSVPRIAVVGRQNVGKSTLVNRLFGKRETIAHDDPGVTRDRVELEATWNGKRFGLVDTAGYLHRAKGVEALAGRQASRAMDESQLVLLVVDVASGITEEDAQLARRLRRSTTPVLVVVNKADSRKEEAGRCLVPLPRAGRSDRRLRTARPRRRGAAWTGWSTSCPTPRTPTRRDDTVRRSDEPRFALVGRPNVGKSSLFNRLVGEERSVVFEEAGTTRDSVDALVEWPGAGRIRFVDTAGMRRAIRVQGVEYYSFVRAGEAIDRADAAAVVFDATEGLTAEDEKIAFRVLEAGKALLLVANKWDLVEDKDRTFKRLTEEATMLGRATVVRTSADPRTGGGSHPGAAPGPPPAVGRPSVHLAGERGAPGGAGRPATSSIVRHAALRGAGGDPTALLRRLRRGASSRPRVPPVHREPVPRGVPSGWRAASDELPNADPRPIALSGEVGARGHRLHFRGRAVAQLG